MATAHCVTGGSRAALVGGRHWWQTQCIDLPAHLPSSPSCLHSPLSHFFPYSLLLCYDHVVLNRYLVRIRHVGFEMRSSVLATNLCGESFTLLVLVHGIRYSRLRRSISDIEFTEKKPLSTRISPSLDPTAETFSRHKLMILRRDSCTDEDLHIATRQNSCRV